MSDNDKNAQTVTLSNVRLSFPTLVDPQASVKDGPKKFSANFIIDPSTPGGKANIEKIKAAIKAAEIDHFGETGKLKAVAGDRKRMCFRPGDQFVNQDGDVYDGYEGMVGLSANARKRPILFDRHKREVAYEDIEDVFVGGYFCDAKVRLFCVSDTDKGGRGLFAEIKGIRSRQEGEPFGNVNDTSADDFDDIEDDDGFGGEGESDDDTGSGAAGGHSLLD